MSTKSIKALKRVGDADNASVLGYYEGECMDTNITNLNGLDIGKKVMETVLASDDYKKGIKEGWYLGFLGHPEDPQCQDFKNACIKMLEGHMSEDGKVYGKFALLATPVGEIVKTMIDASVNFGISIRGLGEVVNNSVDPETFTFRGFDLVIFPAYPNSVPVFNTIAASADNTSRANYQKICATVLKNVPEITNNVTLDVLKGEFQRNPELCGAIDSQSRAILSDTVDDGSLDKERVEAMLDLYLTTIQELHHVAGLSTIAKRKFAEASTTYDRTIKSIKRITANQEKLLLQENNNLANELDRIRRINLKYKRDIEETSGLVESKNAIIAGLKSQLRETVTANKSEGEMKKLKQNNGKLRNQLTSVMASCKEFQDAYASLYASALGLRVSKGPERVCSTVEEIQNWVEAGTNTVNMPAVPGFDDEYEDEWIDDDIPDEYDDNPVLSPPNMYDDLITL